jgi:SOS-response transcriptional repressor LexA
MKQGSGFLIHPGDIMVVNQAVDIVNGCLVMAVADGEMLLRQMVRQKGGGVSCAPILLRSS